MLPGQRTPSSEIVLVPARLLVKLYAVILRFAQAVVEGRAIQSVDRIELAAVKREFEEIVGKIAPQVIRKAILADEEPTPCEAPRAKDLERSKKS